MIKKEQIAEAFIRKHALTRYEHVSMKCVQGLYDAIVGGLKPAGWVVYEGPRKQMGYYLFKVKKQVGGVTSQERLMAELDDLVNQLTKVSKDQEALKDEKEKLTQRLQLFRKQCKHNDNGEGKCKNCGYTLYVKDCANAN